MKVGCASFLSFIFLKKNWFWKIQILLFVVLKNVLFIIFSKTVSIITLGYKKRFFPPKLRKLLIHVSNSGITEIK